MFCILNLNIKKKIFCFVFISALFFISCKKNNISADENALNTEISKVYYAYKTQQANLSNIASSKSNTNFTEEKDIIWGKTTFNINGQFYLTPIKDEKQKIEKNDYFNYLISYTDENKNIILSKYCVVAAKDATGKFVGMNESLAGELIINKKQTDSKTIFTEYNLDNSVSNIKNNNTSSVGSGTVYQISAEPTILANLESTNCTTAVVDWYLLTYQNGVLISVEYLYSTYETNCTTQSGGGGGGTNNPPPNNCAAPAYNFLNAGTSATGLIDVTEENVTSVSKTKNYLWRIYKAVTWFLISRERAQLEYVQVGANTSYWKFISIQHMGLSPTGFSVGGNRTFSDNGAIFNMSSTHTMVAVSVSYDVTSSPNPIPGCPGSILPPYQQSLTSNINLYSNSSVGI